MCRRCSDCPSGAIVAHWLQKSGPSTYAYDVRLSHSTDDGKTWSPSFLPHHDGTQTEHGFASLFPMGDGFGLVWLDGRAMKAGGEHGEHGGGGAMSVRLRALRQDLQADRRERRSTARVRMLSDGRRGDREGVITAYRNRSDEEIRDNYVSRFVNGKWIDAAGRCSTTTGRSPPVPSTARR